MEETVANGDKPVVVETHYDTLGIAQDATADRVHRAFTAVLAEYRDNPTPETEDRTRRARIAHKVLSDPDSRALYNAGLQIPDAPGRRWEKAYLEEEEERLSFWIGFTTFAFMALLGFFWQFLILKVLLWIPRALYRSFNAFVTRKRPVNPGAGEAAETAQPNPQ